MKEIKQFFAAAIGMLIFAAACYAFLYAVMYLLGIPA